MLREIDVPRHGVEMQRDLIVAVVERVDASNQPEFWDYIRDVDVDVSRYTHMNGSLRWNVHGTTMTMQRVLLLWIYAEERVDLWLSNSFVSTLL